jgi:hypothetical protein
MKRNVSRTSLFAGFLAASTSVQASVFVGSSFISANELLAKCQTEPLYTASPHDPKKDNAEAAKEGALAAMAGGYCLGFIAGASDMIEATTVHFVCRPVDTNIGKIEELFIDYLNRHPDKGEQSAVGLIGSALGEAFRC